MPFLLFRQMQEKFRAKEKKLYFGFVDLEKVFDRVPREVIRWAMHKLGVEEWLVGGKFIIIGFLVYVTVNDLKQSFSSNTATEINRGKLYKNKTAS